MKIMHGEVIPGKRIGEFHLGMTKTELLQLLGNEYQTNGGKYEIIRIENAGFWIGRDNQVYQIGVTYGFEGKFDNTVMIGSTMKDIQKKYVGYVEVYDTYEIKGIKGMSFELKDAEGEWDELEEDAEEEWDELTAPIEWIFVYQEND